MKKFFVFVLLLTLLTACAPAVQSVIDLPDNVELGITSVVVWLVSWVFVQLITLVPFLKFLEDFKQPLALAVSGQLISLIENLAPGAYETVIVNGIVLVLSILALFGVGQVFAARNYRGFKSR